MQKVAHQKNIKKQKVEQKVALKMQIHKFKKLKFTER